MKLGANDPITNIGKQRKALKLTQKQVADGIGCDIKTYRDYENGKKRPDTGLLMDMYAYYKKMGVPVSTDYILGISNFRTPSNDFIGNETGLSDTAIDCLRWWYADKKQNDLLQHYANDTDTLNMILEYYEKKRTEGKPEGMFSLFHYIGNFLYAHKFKRVKQDRIRYGNGSQYKDIEIGDSITKKGKREKEVIKSISAINSKTGQGFNHSTVGIVNIDDENEVYDIEIADLYRERAKSQIMDSINQIREVHGLP